MLVAGITVALGTDSIINLPPPGTDADSWRISVLDEMRRLWKRDRTDPRTLLAMATTNGAAALGLARGEFLFESGGPLLGLVALDVRGSDLHAPGLERALSSESAPILLLAGK
jgi:cytosine/adenosine deaminase-related metal-dependent hydrolase